MEGSRSKIRTECPGCGRVEYRSGRATWCPTCHNEIHFVLDAERILASKYREKYGKGGSK